MILTLRKIKKILLTSFLCSEKIKEEWISRLNFDLYRMKEHPLLVPKKLFFFFCASCCYVLAMSQQSKSTRSVIQIHIPYISIPFVVE